MSEKETQIVRNYLVKAGVKYMEFYQELFDHIATSFGERTKKDTSIEQHLEAVISPEFGGMKGIENLVNQQGKFISSSIYREGWNTFLQFFTTAQGLFKSLVTLGLLYLLESLVQFNLITEIGIPIIIIPYLLLSIAQWRFKRKCKADKLPYTLSVTNSTILGITTILVVSFQAIPSLFSLVIIGKGFNTLEYLAQFDALVIPVVFLLLLYNFVCLTLIFRKYNLKPVFN